MKEKDLLEIKKLKLEIKLVFDNKENILQSLKWYRQSAEHIEEHYNQLVNMLQWYNRKLREIEKRVENIVNQYDVAGCQYHLCNETKLKNKMKLVLDKYFCDENCFEKQEELKKQHPHHEY